MGAVQGRGEHTAEDIVAALADGDLGDRDLEIIGAIVDLLADAPVTDETLTRIVERVASAQDLGGATLSLVRDDGGSLLIEPLVAVGIHAAFAREMSARPLESLADVATAVKDRTPVFVGAAHRAPESGTRPEGVGRWRSGVSLHTTGVLPVCARGETLGVLTVEWPDSRPLGDHERRMLDTVSKLLGLGLHVRGSAEPRHQGETQEPHAEDTSASPIAGAFAVTAQGHVVPLAEETDTAVDRTLLLETALGQGPGGVVALLATATPAPRTTAIFLGATTHSAPAPAVCSHRAVATGAFQRFAGQHVTPSEALVYTDQALRAGWADSDRPPVLSAIICEIRQTDGIATMTLAAQGAVTWMLLAEDGRSSFPPESGQLDADASDVSRVAEHHLIGLPGDRLLIACGDPSAPDALRALTAGVRAAAEEARPTDGRLTAAGLVGAADNPANPILGALVIAIGR